MAHARRFTARGPIALLALAIFAASVLPARAEVTCLSDEEIRVLVRSVYTRAIGRVLRICADTHRDLDQRAIQASTDFLTTYAEQMRINRAAANELMARIYQNWEEAFALLLAQATAGDEAWARSASEEECVAEIERIERVTTVADYASAMTTPRTERQFDIERANVPRCE